VQAMSLPMHGVPALSYRSRAKIRTNTFGAPRILWIIGKLAGEICGFPEIREGNAANSPPPTPAMFTRR
jgi:hypothetical protein